MTSRFQVDADRAEELGARIEDVAQEAIDATVRLYEHDATVDVAAQLRDQLGSRALRADDDTVAELADEIRSGHRIDVGRSDGSVTG